MYIFLFRIKRVLYVHTYVLQQQIPSQPTSSTQTSLKLWNQLWGSTNIKSWGPGKKKQKTIGWTIIMRRLAIHCYIRDKQTNLVCGIRNNHSCDPDDIAQLACISKKIKEKNGRIISRTTQCFKFFPDYNQTIVFWIYH